MRSRASGNGWAGFDSPPCALSDVTGGSAAAVCRFIPMAWHDDYSYHEALVRLWGHDGPIVNVEHDHDFSDALVADLLACPHPLCTHAYRMYVPREHYAHGWASDVPAFRERGQGVRWIEEGDEWADHSGIGFCKITPEVRVTPPERTSWAGLEMSVNAAISGRWHVHHPGVAHHHR